MTETNNFSLGNKILQFIEEQQSKTFILVANKTEKFLEAWIIETGLLPSQSSLCHCYDNRDGKFVFRCWIERREIKYRPIFSLKKSLYRRKVKE